eukprot:276593-Rhodomonas_salina.1
MRCAALEPSLHLCCQRAAPPPRAAHAQRLRLIGRCKNECNLGPACPRRTAVVSTATVSSCQHATKLAHGAAAYPLPLVQRGHS